jgi:hypothetical protein
MPTESTRDHGRFHEREHDIEIVNHQIKHDADVGRAGRVGREPVRFDEARFGRGGLEIFENGIEPLDVADLQDAIFLLRDLNQVRRPARFVGHRFFDEDVFALLQQRFGDFKMRDGRRDDVERVGISAASAMELKTCSLCFAAILRAESACASKMPANSTVAGGFLEFGIDARVMLSERAGAEDGDFDLCHARSVLPQLSTFNFQL